MHIIDTTLQVNKFARRNRHLRIFSKRNLYKIRAGYVLSAMLVPARALGTTPLFTQIRRFLFSVKLFIIEILPIAPQKRLLFQAILVSTIAVVVSSLTAGANFTAASMGYSNDYISAYSLPGDILVSDEDGYLVKVNPQTDNSNRIGLTDYAVHTVSSGESLSVIAGKYGVSVETIMWENKMYNANAIRSGQTLLIPPVDGISYTVEGGDSLEKIAAKYDLPAESIIAQNNLAGETIHKGENLFLPGAEPLSPAPTVVSNYRAPAATRDTRSLATATPSTSAPAIGKMFIYPTTGKVTQGYNSGHYALDIADRSQPPIWAGASGTVIKASSGTWGGGYGNHIIVDHGNGVQSLYAHMGTLNVYEGQEVTQGEVIGIMGNSGRVYGVTGIHLHWEVIVNGIKKNPYNYF